MDVHAQGMSLVLPRASCMQTTPTLTQACPAPGCAALQQLEPPGMHMVVLPYADDLRSPEVDMAPPAPVRASDAQVAAAEKLLDACSLDGGEVGGWSSASVSNPATVRHNEVLQVRSPCGNRCVCGWVCGWVWVWVCGCVEGGASGRGGGGGRGGPGAAVFWWLDEGPPGSRHCRDLARPGVGACGGRAHVAHGSVWMTRAVHAAHVAHTRHTCMQSCDTPTFDTPAPVRALLRPWRWGGPSRPWRSSQTARCPIRSCWRSPRWSLR